MSHIVIHDDNSNDTHYATFEALDAAVAYLEQIVNEDADTNARLYALEPVEFAVKSYVRVEIGAAGEGPAPAIDPPVAAPVEVLDAPTEVFTDAASDDALADETPVDDTVEYVEAAMAPVDAYASSAAVTERTEDGSGAEPRRGLFGR